MSDATDIQRLVPNPDRDSVEWWEALAPPRVRAPALRRVPGVAVAAA